MRILELYAGIGGCAAAVAGRATVAMAVDQSPWAGRVYAHNFGHAPIRWNLAGVKAAQLADAGADLWWMSPPCQPFTVRGAQRDIDDPRCRSFLRLLDLLVEVKPAIVALENVPTFAGSRAHALLTAALHQGGYQWWAKELCPSALGVPNQRRRLYVLATRDGPPPPPAARAVGRPLRTYLDGAPEPELEVSAELRERYAHALPITEVDCDGATTFCYTSAYGRSPVYSGSYVRDRGSVRRLAPREILRLLHFPDTYAIPSEVPRARAWQLVGNSLSVAAVQAVLDGVLPTPA